MVRFVAAGWLASQPAPPAFRLVDPRRPTRYLQGHIQGAINVPVSRAFDPEGRLLPEDRLAAWLGRSGVGTALPVVLYDSYDGQNGAMLAWILEYLGHPDVRFLATPFDGWAAGGDPVFYRPVPAEPAKFEPQPRPELRASWRDLAAGTALNLLDVRSPEEYSGSTVTEGRPGHIPGAKNLPWLHLVGREESLFLPEERVQPLLSALGVRRDLRTVAYCRTGPRAAVALLALQQLGYDVSLYDGSFADWARRSELPVEVGG